MPKFPLLALTLAASAAQGAGNVPPADEEMMALGRSLSQDFWAGRLGAVWARMDAPMRDALGDKPAQLSAARDRILEMSGGPGETLEERIGNVRGIPVYLRVFRGTNGTGPLLEQWAIENNAVAGFYVRPTELKSSSAAQQATPNRQRYGVAGLALAATALAMVGLNVWLKRTKTTD
jgi:hypothetical protein